MVGPPVDLTPEDIEIMSNLLCVLPHDEEQQSRVRSDVRTRLTRGLESTKYITASSGARSTANIADAAALFMLYGCRAAA
jgi:hypothetical protein